MLRISIQENESTMIIKLEGRFAGPYVAELSRVWADTAPIATRKKLALDLTNVTYADIDGTEALRGIYSETHAELLTGNPWTQSLAQQISRSSAVAGNEEL